VPPRAARSSRPHVLLITMDELRRDALSCAGAQAVDTPHLDRLAGQSHHFRAAYAPSPLCLPSRVSIATGLYPHSSGAASNHPPSRLDPELPNLYTLLRSQGYTTSHIGKCHYLPVPYRETRPGVTLPYDEFRDAYVALGMDHLDLQDDKQVSVWFYDDYSKALDAAGWFDAYRDATWDRDKAKVFTFPGPAQWHPDSWVGRRAVEFIDGRSGADPLFLWVSFSGPHYPFDPPAEYLDRVDPERVGLGERRHDDFDNPRKVHYRSYHGPGGIDGCGPAPGRACKNYPDEYWRRLRRHYLANVAQIDDEIGRILAAAERTLGDHLLVVFTCDHGEMLGNHGLWGKEKCGYQDVVHAPLFVREPGQTVGRLSDALVSLVDVMPTCLAAAHVDAPRVDGRDLLGPHGDRGYDTVFSESIRFVAATDGRLKYIRHDRDDTALTELYDLAPDPGEFVNKADDPSYADPLAQMQAAVCEHLGTDGA